MNVVTTDPTTSVPAQATSRRRYVLYLLFTLCASLYFLPFMRVFMGDPVEGGILYRAVCVVHGQTFGRDFVEMIGPGSYYWLSLFFCFFGITFFASRVCLFFTSLGTALLMCFLSRRVCGRYWALPCILLFSTYFGALWPAISPHTDSNFLALFGVACMVLWLDNQRRRLLLVAGVVAGVTTWFLIPKGVLLLGAFVLWLCWVQRLRWSACLASLSLIAGGYLCAVGLMLSYFWRLGVLREFVDETFLWPFRHYSAVGKVPYGLGTIQYHWIHWETGVQGIHWMAGISAVLVLPFLLMAVLPALVPALGFRYRTDLARPEISLYWLCGWALWFSEIHRKDTFHLVYGAPLLIILCVSLLEKYPWKIAAVALQVFSISAVSLVAFNLFIVLIAHPVVTRVGTVAMFNDYPALTFLENHVPPGTKIFAYPYCSQYYFFSATANPTRYNAFIYGVTAPSMYREVMRDLDREKVRYVIWDTNFETKEAGKFFPAMPRMTSHDSILEPYLESHYRVVEEAGGMRIMERQADDHADQH